ncbi:MAG: hypothetical protein PHU44_04300 [Syntrophales bacterium]|nr:hypothetical protein [Syntrophales bacterium]MDD5640513.1 hypothetical protein [Syntrophales bacterium]
MTLTRLIRPLMLLYVISAVLTLAGPTWSQTKAPTQPQKSAAPPAKCGPDHAILYKRAVNLLDKAEKKLAAKYTAEAKALLKESNSLFTILLKECGPQQKERTLTSGEEQQEAVNKKLAAGELAQAERLEKSAAAKLKKSEQAAQKEIAVKYAREAKGEFERAQVNSLRAGIYSLRNQQMLFRWLAK